MGDAWMKMGQLVRCKTAGAIGIVVEVFESSFGDHYGPWYTIYWVASGRKEDLHQSRLEIVSEEEAFWRTWGDI